MRNIEDKIIEALKSAELRYYDDTFSCSAEVEHGNAEASAVAEYECLKIEDWQCFDGRYELVQTEREKGELLDLEVECWDADTGEDVQVDIGYIKARI